MYVKFMDPPRFLGPVGWSHHGDYHYYPGDNFARETWDDLLDNLGTTRALHCWKHTQETPVPEGGDYHGTIVWEVQPLGRTEEGGNHDGAIITASEGLRLIRPISLLYCEEGIRLL